MVPAGSIILMAVNALVGIAVPVGLSWYLVRKHHVKISTILIGAGTFLVFALILESILHQVVLNGPHGAAIRDNRLWYALYGGLAAGLFEETGRFLSMKFLMKKEPSTQLPAVAYGVGHGGAEMLLLFGLTMISYLAISVMINAGQGDMLFADVPEEASVPLQAQLDLLQNSQPGTWLLGLWERFSALILQLALSCLVWVAVRKGGKWLWLFPAAIVLHALVDGVVVLLKDAVGMVALEAILFAAALAVAAFAYRIVKQTLIAEETAQ